MSTLMNDFFENEENTFIYIYIYIRRSMIQETNFQVLTSDCVLLQASHQDHRTCLSWAASRDPRVETNARRLFLLILISCATTQITHT